MPLFIGIGHDTGEEAGAHASFPAEAGFRGVDKLLRHERVPSSVRTRPDLAPLRRPDAAHTARGTSPPGRQYASRSAINDAVAEAGS